MNKKKNKAKTIVIAVLVALIVAVSSLNCRIHFSHRWKVKPYQVEHYSKPQNYAEFIDRSDLKLWVKNLVDTPHIYHEKANLPQLARTSILFRSITIRKGLDNETFALTYAHELVHIKYLCQNETYTSYKTFVILYESKNVTLRNVAERYAIDVLAGGWKGTAYDIGYYIQNYLNKRNIKL